VQYSIYDVRPGAEGTGCHRPWVPPLAKKKYFNLAGQDIHSGTFGLRLPGTVAFSYAGTCCPAWVNLFRLRSATASNKEAASMRYPALLIDLAGNNSVQAYINRYIHMQLNIIIDMIDRVRYR